MAQEGDKHLSVRDMPTVEDDPSMSRGASDDLVADVEDGEAAGSVDGDVRDDGQAAGAASNTKETGFNATKG